MSNVKRSCTVRLAMPTEGAQRLEPTPCATMMTEARCVRVRNAWSPNGYGYDPMDNNDRNTINNNNNNNDNVNEH